MSINQNDAYTSTLPDFRNLGILLRILIIVDAACLTAALLTTSQPIGLADKLLDYSAQVQPILILSLLSLAAANDMLHRLRYSHSIVTILVLEVALATVVYYLGFEFYKGQGALERTWVFTLLLTAFLIGYFDLRGHALSPALTEARLQALQARIRPHFLFNSMNAVLSLIRQDPRRAEHALEDLADLFRVLMADNRQLVPLAQEVDLAKRYLSIEQLRLGERLNVQWDAAEMPSEALIPPFVLQPLLENAVYHGIEPRTEAGVITIRIHRHGDQVHLQVRNPYRPQSDHHDGNRMALANIRERLTLHFDAEASIKTDADQDSYEVRVVLPYKREGNP